jgi:hypothetical protein
MNDRIGRILGLVTAAAFCVFAWAVAVLFSVWVYRTIFN